MIQINICFLVGVLEHVTLFLGATAEYLDILPLLLSIPLAHKFLKKERQSILQLSRFLHLFGDLRVKPLHIMYKISAFTV